MFKKNVGSADRVIRAIVGVAALLGFFMMSTTGILHWVLLLVGVIGLGTAAMSSCPIYSIFGLRTCPLDKAK